MTLLRKCSEMRVWENEDEAAMDVIVCFILFCNCGDLDIMEESRIDIPPASPEQQEAESIPNVCSEVLFFI